MTTKTMRKKEIEKVRKLIKGLGGVNEVHKGLIEFTIRVEHMESLRAELLKQHPNKWVAMADGKIVTNADSLEDVLKELDAFGIRRRDAVVEFMDTHPRNMIL